MNTREWPHLFAVFLPLLLLYLVTAPRTVVLEDDGLFILSSWFLGIEHPPGYPLFILLGKLATWLPFGSVAWRVHALNGLFAALTCVLVFLISRQITPGRAPAYLAALGLGVSETFWSEALIADVYPLHALIFFVLLYLVISQRQSPAPDDPTTNRRLYLTALLLGLGFANHWPLMLLSGPALLLLWLPDHRRVWPRMPWLLATFALGLLPYAWMIWRSQQQPQISFQGSLDNWAEVVGYFLRTGYADVDNSASSGTDDRLLYLAYLVRAAGAQLLLPGALLALIGAFTQWRRWGLLIAAALTIAFLGPTLLLTVLLGFDFQPLQREAFRVYPLVAWGVLALWAGLGLSTVVGHLQLHQRGLVISGLVTVLLAATLIAHWDRNDRHTDRLAHDYAAALLDALATDARLLLRSDFSIPATAYLHLIEERRPDVTLITESALVLEPKLFDPLHTPLRARKPIIDSYIAASDKPLYRMHNEDARSGTFSWLLFHLDTTSQPGAGDVRFLMTEQERQLLRWLAQVDRFPDGWNEMLRRVLLTKFTDFQTRAELTEQWSTDDAELEAIRAQVLQLPEAALMRAELLFAVNGDAHAAEINQLVTRFAEQSDDPGLSKRDLARFYNLIAQIAQRRGREEAFRTAIQTSLEYWPGTDNPAYTAAKRLQELDDGRPQR